MEHSIDKLINRIIITEEHLHHNLLQKPVQSLERVVGEALGQLIRSGIPDGEAFTEIDRSGKLGNDIYDKKLALQEWKTRASTQYSSLIATYVIGRRAIEACGDRRKCELIAGVITQICCPDNLNIPLSHPLANEVQ